MTGGVVVRPGRRGPIRVRLNRYWCPACRAYATVVREVGVVEVRCPRCETVAVPCRGVEGWQA
jgi:hypothetical protein